MRLIFNSPFSFVFIFLETIPPLDTEVVVCKRKVMLPLGESKQQARLFSGSEARSRPGQAVK